MYSPKNAAAKMNTNDIDDIWSLDEHIETEIGSSHQINTKRRCDFSPTKSTTHVDTFLAKQGFEKGIGIIANSTGLKCRITKEDH